MTNEQQEQLNDAMDYLDQARALFLELAESLMESDSDNFDEEPENNGDMAEQMENAAVTIEELCSALEELREAF